MGAWSRVVAVVEMVKRGQISISFAVQPEFTEVRFEVRER